MSSVQLQWALNSDVATIAQLFKSVLKAASTDSVQGGTIVACQEVGVKLPLSSETKDRVMRDMVPTPVSTTIKFLKATVGFSPTDSATLLATSEPGIRFLGLAAALVPTVGPYPSAQVLGFELRRTSLKLTEQPTVQHLEQLLEALRPRTERCNFTELVARYQMMLEGELRIQENLLGVDTSMKKRTLLSGVPSPEAVAGLIDVFRQLARIGDSTVTGATIMVRGSAPWILAFAEWCLGEGASIRIEGRQKPVIEQNKPNFSLDVVLFDKLDSNIEPLQAIIHHQRVDDILQLLGPIDPRPLRFMVKITSYSQWLLTRLDFKRHGDSDFNTWMQKMLYEALQHAIPQILSITCGKYGKLGQDQPSVPWTRAMHDPVQDLAISPLPAIPEIAAACSKFLNLRGTLRFPPGHKCLSIPELPLVQTYLVSLKKRCPCENCSQTPAGLCLGERSCLQDTFFQSLAFLVLDILAFSLIDCNDALLAFASPDRRTSGIYKKGEILHEVAFLLEFGNWEHFNEEDAEENLEEDAEEAIEEESGDGHSENSKERIDVEDIFEWAKCLVGHGDIDDQERTLIMTSKRGQVVYPLLFETYRIEKNGYFRLCVLPGTIRCDGLVYDIVSYPDEDAGIGELYEHPILPESLEVTHPRNLLDKFEVSWRAEAQPNKQMHLYLIMQDSERQSFVVRSDPMLALKSLSDILLLEGCPHGPRPKLSKPDNFCHYIAPWHDRETADTSASTVDIVAIASSDLHRFFALGYLGFPVVLRRNACLSCCLQVCRHTLINRLIL